MIISNAPYSSFNVVIVDNVKLVIPSHAHYIQFGIITRIALKNKIKVWQL